VEVSSYDYIDCGVMDDSSYRKFAVADSDEGIEKVIWVEKRKYFKFSFKPRPASDYWLILFNAYSGEDTYAAYSISSEKEPLEVSAEYAESYPLSASA
jgi:hypothetical protein